LKIFFVKKRKSPKSIIILILLHKNPILIRDAPVTVHRWTSGTGGGWIGGTGGRWTGGTGG
jgi:hypothetical protein